MSWQEFITQYTARNIMEWTGAPKRTVYAWRDGTNSPPAWQQPIFIAWIERKARE